MNNKMESSQPDFTKMSLDEVVKFEKQNRKQWREKERNAQKMPGFKSKAISKHEKARGGNKQAFKGGLF